MIDAVQLATDDSSVGVIVITGTGERAFCAGGDVSEENEETFRTADVPFDEIAERLYGAMRASLKPSIARINGYAIGGGHHLAYMCDFSIAADHAILGQNGPRVASPAEGWVVAHLWQVVGMKIAKEIWMLCRRYSAEQALSWGLVNAVVPMAELDDEVRRWANDLLEKSPTVISLIKKSFDESWDTMREALDKRCLLDEINPNFFASGEQTEGANAFMEKRTPDFSRWR
jgi:1,4-dihydroxy-2-naphthoyl-CoA synthase